MNISKWIYTLFGLFLMYGFYQGITAVQVIVYILLGLVNLLYFVLHCLPKDLFKEFAIAIKKGMTGLVFLVTLAISGLWVYVGLITNNTTFLYFYALTLFLSYSLQIRAFLTKTDEV